MTDITRNILRLVDYDKEFYKEVLLVCFNRLAKTQRVEEILQQLCATYKSMNSENMTTEQIAELVRNVDYPLAALSVEDKLSLATVGTKLGVDCINEVRESGDITAYKFNGRSFLIGKKVDGYFIEIDGKLALDGYASWDTIKNNFGNWIESLL